jgi:hypothetical protein
MFRDYISRAPMVQSGYRGPMWLARAIARRLRKFLAPFPGKNENNRPKSGFLRDVLGIFYFFLGKSFLFT